MFCFVFICFFIYYFTLEFFHKFDITNTILLFIYVKNTFRALKCEMFRKKRKKKKVNKKPLTTKAQYFFVSSQRYQVFKHYLQNPKVPKNPMDSNNHN